MKVIQKELMPQVTLTAVCTDKFKSSRLSLTLMTPMERETVTANALLPSVLRRGCRQYPDNQALAAALDELYGGELEASVRQQGETQCVGLTGSFLDDSYSLDGSPILEPAARLLGQLLLEPALENGAFRRDYVRGEGKNLADCIQAQVNEKRQYALLRLKEQMCQGEPYGLNKLGFADEALSISPERLWERCQQLLSTAPIALYYCGSAPAERVEQALGEALSGLPERKNIQSVSLPAAVAPAQQPRFFEDAMDVTQGKLVLGWRTGGINLRSEQFPALQVFNALYGGTSTSKLFMNVRERLSLCYYASSALDSLKGLMLVSSGIEFDKAEQAREEILTQFRACVRGEFTEQKLQAARSAVVSSLKASLDSQGLLEQYWQSQAAAGLCCGPEELARSVEQVTAEQVADAAGKLQLDAVYFLKGKEG
ncbi:MAG: insulinase family protein [Oscillospiraceae bacterium]|nr:insulinase family protein [Oscillospiraceae bacterium]